MYSLTSAAVVHPPTRQNAQHMAGDVHTGHQHDQKLGDVSGCLRAGKTTLVRQAAMLCGQRLVEVALHSGTDASDLLGGFEQHSSEDTGQVPRPGHASTCWAH